MRLAAVAVLVAVVSCVPVETSKGRYFVLAFDPLNDATATMALPRWENWYYHAGFFFEGQPNSNSAPTYRVRMRSRIKDADGIPTMNGDMTIEITNSSGRYSSDETSTAYDVRVEQTMWNKGVISSPEFVVAQGQDGIRQTDVNTAGGLNRRDAATIGVEAAKAAFGEKGNDPKVCRVLLAERIDETVTVSCVVG